MEREKTLSGGASLLAGQLPAEREALLGFVRHLVAGARAPLDPEDIVQDVMERALRYAHAYDPALPLRPWLRRAALRVFLDQRERWQRDLARQVAPPDTEPGTRQRDALADADDVERLLASLSPVERTVLCRFHGECCSIAELATELGLPEGTVKSHLHRARRRLREAHPDRDRP